MKRKIIFGIIILWIFLSGCTQTETTTTQEPESKIVTARLDQVTGGDFVPSAGYYEGELELTDTKGKAYSIFACSKSWDWVKKGHCYRFDPEEINENIKQRMFSAELSGCYVGNLEEVEC